MLTWDVLCYVVYFFPYSENTIMSMIRIPGMKLKESNLNSLRHVDDTLFVAESEKDLQHTLDFVTESENKGL